MIIPSIDLMNGHAVQLEQGRTLRIDAGDPRPIAERFAVLGEVAVIDLDAALGKGSNEAVIRDLLRIARCRVGGGIRDVETARRWLDLGAHKVILGTAAKPELLEQLPRDRVIAALDSRDGDVVVEGWTRGTGAGVAERMAALREFVGGFLVTFVEREGMLGGFDVARAEALREVAGDARVTVAGGVVSAAEVAALDRLGMDAQVGMAIYTGRLDPADAVSGVLTSERPDGLFPTVVVDERGIALGLVWSSAESLRLAVAERRGIYHSRRRGIWRKGEESGAVQELLRVDVDCDRDSLRFTVRQAGTGFCHTRARTCWGAGAGIGSLESRLASTLGTDSGSYSARLLRDPALLNAKLIEEGGELGRAATREEVVHEAADVVYFTGVKLQSAGVSWAEVERELDRRALRLTRRGGNAKPPTASPAPGSAGGNSR
jgi:phosphoribosyl-ATP pyrophosphohydrolase/phosphoribosyl-AMP cyclohydrolase